MTTIGHRIAAACGDGTVCIYNSVTGVLRLSLSPAHPTKAMTGSPDGSALFCVHPESPSITMWDIQTGGIIHTFALNEQVNVAAVSLEGHYLACGLSSGTVNIWEVANKMEGPAFSSGLSTPHLCWLAPEEQLMITNGLSVHIWDVITRSVLRSFTMLDPICGAAYSQELNQLAIGAGSGAESTVTTTDPQKCALSTSRRIQRRLSRFAFSRTTNELVCGMMTNGLQLFNVSTLRWREFDHPATITSVSTLSNGTVVVNTTDYGIQLLDLDEGYAPSRHPIPPTVTALPLDEDRIIVIIPASLDSVILLRSTTMLRLLTIPVRIHTGRTVILCASLENSMAVRCFRGEEGEENLQLWKYSGQLPEWTVEIGGLPSVGKISPVGTRLVTFHTAEPQTCICVRDLENGRLLAKLSSDHPSPCDIIFDSEDRFYSQHDTYRVPYVLVPSWESCVASHSIICHGRLPLGFQPPKRSFFVDDSREWVIGGSKKICWIPPGYIGLARASYCWVGSSLVMVGQDGMLRKLTFRE